MFGLKDILKWKLARATAAQVAAGATSGALAVDGSGNAVKPDGSLFTAVQAFSTVTLNANYTLQAADQGKRFLCTVALTVTQIPGGPEVIIVPPATGLVTISPQSGSVLLNGVSAALTRARANNPVGVSIAALPESANAFGVSGG